MEIIKKIPLARIVFDNVLIWPHSYDGRYTYKSSYGFLKEEAEMDSSQLLTRPDTKLWKDI